MHSVESAHPSLHTPTLITLMVQSPPPGHVHVLIHQLHSSPENEPPKRSAAAQQAGTENTDFYLSSPTVKLYSYT